LNSIPTLKCFVAGGTGIGVGLSDHTLSKYTPMVAVALGATVIEKHLNASPHSSTSDSKVSLNEDEFSEMVQAIRSVPAMMGKFIIDRSPDELHDLLWARRSPVDWLRPTEKAREGAWE
jgi:sialic acid synthase SpsE